MPNQSSPRETLASVTADVRPRTSAGGTDINGAKIAAALGVPALNIRLEAGDEFVGELLIVTELDAIHDAVEARAAAPPTLQRQNAGPIPVRA